VDSDPEVMSQTLPNGYSSIDYIELAKQAESTLGMMPTLQAGVEHNQPVAAYGAIEIRRISP
jgi:hypothetical protein